MRLKFVSISFLLFLSGQLFAGITDTITINSTGDNPDLDLTGICDTGGLIDGQPECTLRAAIAVANADSNVTEIFFNVVEGCVDSVCVIDVDDGVNGPLPDITAPVIIDGSTQPGNANVCSQAISQRPDYAIVIEGDSIQFGLRLELGSGGSNIRGINIRNFFNNIAIVRTNNNTIECNFIGTDETGMNAASGNVGNGIILGCDSSNNVIGGPQAENGNLISAQQSDGVQFFADLPCGVNGTSPTLNAVLGNFIGTFKDGVSLAENTFSGISFFGGPANNNFIGSLQDATTINGNVIAGSESGVYIDDGTENIFIVGNFIGTDLTGTVDLGNVFGGVDIISGSNNQVGFVDDVNDLVIGNVIAFNSEGVFVTGNDSANNSIRGNHSYNNGSIAIDLITDGNSIEPDGENMNDANDADMGANKLMNTPQIIAIESTSMGAMLVSEINYLVDSSTENAAYPLSIDVYFDSNDATTIQGGEYQGSFSYTEAQAQAPALVTLELPTTAQGGFISLTATDAEGNTSELSQAVMVIDADIIFADGFEN